MYLAKSTKAFVYLKTVAIVQILLKSPQLTSTKGKAIQDKGVTLLILSLQI